MIYYNENNPEAAAWLHELITQRAIPYGYLDTRSIEDVRPSDLYGFTQCHFFAGIGGWAHALHLAGWGARSIWTASCPCQPFSTAGKVGGFADERHLWPALHWLVSKCKPLRLVGEQVASPAGREWFDLVATDCEAYEYACAAAIIPAAGVKAPHLRRRLYWVADASDERRFGWRPGKARTWLDQARLQLERSCATRGLADDHQGGRIEQRTPRLHDQGERGHDAVRRGADDHWDNADWIPCTDGRYRPVEPGTQPLAYGVPARVGRLRGYGNAIVPQLAAAFIEAAL